MSKIVIRRIVSIAAVTLLISSCVMVRHVTYPPEFVYLEKSEVAGVMHEMADSLYMLEDLVSGIGREDHPAGTELEAMLLAELDSVESAASKLSTGTSSGNVTTNHLLIDENIDQFLDDLAAARLQLIARPPNYFMVGQLTGGCNACHSQR